MGCVGSKQDSTAATAGRANKAVGGKKGSGASSSSASKPPPRVSVGNNNKNKQRQQNKGSSKIDAKATKPDGLKDSGLEEHIKACIKQKKKLKHVPDPQPQVAKIPDTTKVVQSKTANGTKKRS